MSQSQSIATYDFQRHGVGSRTAAALRANFASWEALRDSPASQLMDIKGVTPAIAEDLITTARAMVQAQVASEQAKESSRIYDLHKTGEKLFITNARNADSRADGTVTNIKRRRVELTPAVCDECGEDIGEALGVRPWRKIKDPATKERVLAAVAEHKAKRHDLASKNIVTESELKMIARAAAIRGMQGGDDEDEDDDAEDQSSGSEE